MSSSCMIHRCVSLNRGSFVIDADSWYPLLSRRTLRASVFLSMLRASHRYRNRLLQIAQKFCMSPVRSNHWQCGSKFFIGHDFYLVLSVIWYFINFRHSSSYFALRPFTCLFDSNLGVLDSESFACFNATFLSLSIFILLVLLQSSRSLSSLAQSWNYGRDLLLLTPLRSKVVVLHVIKFSLLWPFVS